jgi:hypothetical protein
MDDFVYGVSEVKDLLFPLSSAAGFRDANATLFKQKCPTISPQRAQTRLSATPP